MMGTSLLSMPWALEQAGVVFGMILLLGMGALACYTAYRVVQSPDGLRMFTLLTLIVNLSHSIGHRLARVLTRVRLLLGSCGRMGSDNLLTRGHGRRFDRVLGVDE